MLKYASKHMQTAKTKISLCVCSLIRDLAIYLEKIWAQLFKTKDVVS